MSRPFWYLRCSTSRVFHAAIGKQWPHSVLEMKSALVACLSGVKLGQTQANVYPLNFISSTVLGYWRLIAMKCAGKTDTPFSVFNIRVFNL